MKRSILPGSSAEHGAIACMSLKWPDDFRTRPITQMKLTIINAIAMAILGACLAQHLTAAPWDPAAKDHSGHKG